MLSVHFFNIFYLRVKEEFKVFNHKEILNIMKNDKKVISGSLHFILLEDIGSAVVQNNINDQSIINVLEAL